MDISKEQILKAVIKRLTRPRLSNGNFVLDDTDMDPEMALNNKVSVEGIDISEELLYNSNFG